MVVDIKILRPALTVDEAAFAAAQIDFIETKKIQKKYREAQSSKYNLKNIKETDCMEDFAVKSGDKISKYSIPHDIVFQALAEMTVEPNMRTIEGVKEALMMEVNASYHHGKTTELEIFNLSLCQNKDINFQKTTICKASLYTWFKNHGYEIGDLKPVTAMSTPSPSMNEELEKSTTSNDMTNTRERDNLLKMLALATKALSDTKGTAYGDKAKPTKSKIAELLRDYTDDHAGLSVKNITDKISEGLELL